MRTLYDAGDSIIGKRIICEAEIFHKPHRISTKGRHNAQQLKAEGNPVKAIIDQPVSLPVVLCLLYDYSIRG